MMMDADTDIHTGKVWGAEQNGLQYEHNGLGEEDVVVEVDSTMAGQGLDASQETFGESNINRMVNPSPQEEVETPETSEVKEPRPQKSQGRNKTEKPNTAKSSTVKSVKKNNSSKEVKATSNGTLSTSTKPKQAIAKARSFNDRHGINSNPSKTTKPVSATSNTQKAKVVKSELTSDSDSLVQGEGNMEKPKLKPLRKEAALKIEGDGESVGSPTASEGKTLREGKLPSYGFSFRCHERAEKRREFYTKLEEKIHAKEVEKNNLQAKSKETLEAEIKMLRKSLNFKATPMPTFYQEPAPPKAELKKLGRKKNTSGEVEEDGEQRHRPGRLSLDEKSVSQTNPTKVASPVQSRRPQRKSLPKLPSQKTRLSKNAKVPDQSTNGTPPIARVEEEEEIPLTNPTSAPVAHIEDEVLSLSNPTSAPIAHVDEEVVETSELTTTHFGIENGPFVEDNIQGVVLEHWNGIGFIRLHK
ncbi:Protein WVD2-like 5, partial [Bienertia sinuspersici]